MTANMADTVQRSVAGPHKRAKPLPSFETTMMVPALIVLAALSIVPFVFMVWMSFNKVSPIGGFSYQWVGMANWQHVFTDPDIRSSWGTGLIYYGVTLIVEMVVGTAMALAVHELRRSRNLAVSLVIMPIFMAPVIVGLISRFLLNSTFGLYSRLLDVVGVFSGSVLGNEHSALAAVILMDVWEWTPLVALIILAGLTSLPTDIIEAATVDGAGYWQRLRYVVGPMLSGVVAVALLIRSMDLLRYFAKILITTNGGPANATKVIAIRLYENAFRFFNLGYAAAIGITMLAFSVVVAIIFVAVLRRRGLAQ